MPLANRMGRARILLVEDDAVLARSFSRVLSTYLDVRHAATLGEALEALAAEEKLEVVWSDLHLERPNDGVEVLLAASRGHPEALLLLVTGSVDDIGVDRLPRGVVVVQKSQSQDATDLVLRRFRRPD